MCVCIPNLYFFQNMYIYILFSEYIHIYSHTYMYSDSVGAFKYWRDIHQNVCSGSLIVLKL